MTKKLFIVAITLMSIITFDLFAETVYVTPTTNASGSTTYKVSTNSWGW